MTTLQEKNKQIVQRGFDAWDQNAPAEFDAVYATDVVHKNMKIDGVPHLKEILQDWFHAFPDLTHTVHQMVSEGDWVATRFTIAGTHQNEFNGIPPTGVELELPGMAFERVKDGQIVERWIIENMYTFYEQLGMVSSPATSKNKQIVQRIFDGWNAQDREMVANELADDFVYGNIDKEDFLDIEFAFFKPFPDLTYALDDLFAAGDRVVSRWRFTGTHTGQGGPGIFQQAEPTGKRVDIPGISIAQVNEGKVVEWWGQWNDLKLYRELGLTAHLVE